ncbi:MAG: hypothetical protein IT221_04065 [Fluviicola sp.]|nr:hypothetical protein [Fluviicola sp.]
MFKQLFFTGLIASIFGTIISVAYFAVFKYSPLEVDFTEKATIVYLLGFNALVGMSNCFVYFGLSKVIKKEHLAAFINGFLLSAAAIVIALLWMFKVDTSLTFKNETAELYKDYYYFILAPIAFFPVLSWFTFKPLFIKK